MAPPSPSPPPADRLSLFLDVDGTLLDYAAHPDAVIVTPALVELLSTLQALCHGALALVSGRPIATLDALFAPYRGAAVGVHGLEVRCTGTAPIERLAMPPTPEPLRSAIMQVAQEHDTGLIEDKGVAIAVHHRLAAPAMQALRSALQNVCQQRDPSRTVLRGRQVLEVKPVAINKARGVDALMAQAPFAHTLPIGFGDDLTDLDMFAALERHGGFTVAVGPRIAQRAHLHLKTPEHARHLLGRLRDQLAAGHPPAQVVQALAQPAAP